MRNTIKPIGIVFILIPWLILVGCSAINGEGSAPLTDTQQELVQELNQYLIPLPEPPLQLTDSDLSFLEPLKNATIIGLGEATHGTHEFFQMKHRIFRYFVEHAQHKAIAFEADFAESFYIEQYINGSSTDADTVMKNVMHFWTWKTEEVKELLEWLRTYNLTHSVEDRIHYFGFDCQTMTYQPLLLEAYLADKQPGLWADMSSSLSFLQTFSTNDYKTMSLIRFRVLLRQLTNLEQQFKNDQDQLIALSSPSEYQLYLQVFHTVVQAFTLKYKLETGYGNYSRDYYMAENILWITDHIVPQSKITLWAHNGHIANDPTYNGNGSMGYILRKRRGDFYQTIGFALSTGSFTAMSQDAKGNYLGVAVHDITLEPAPNSLNFLCHAASHANFVFEPAAFPLHSHWDKWLAYERPYFMIGATFNGDMSLYYRKTDIRRHFNRIIYFDMTEASRLLR